MDRTAKRTPRACERCRHTRKRCEPPYPCRQCVELGVHCDVRAKARPQRRRPQYRRTTSSPPTDCRRNDRNTNTSRGYSPSRSPSGTDNPRLGSRRTQSDTYELLEGLVQDMLLKRHGYKLDCDLVEPPSCRPDATGGSVSLTHPDAHPHLPLSSAKIWHLLTNFRKFVGWQDPPLVDVEELHALACIHLENLLDLEPAGISVTVTTTSLPLDTIALIFAALALGAVATGEPGHGRFYFGVSTEMVKHFVGAPTLDLCLAYFLQHLFALRSGTSNYAQGIMAQAIQIAHGLGLHENSHGIRGLQLFLLIYMADQYGALQHSTEPIIRTSKLTAQIFTPLSETEPQLQTLIDLITINGYVIEQSHRLSPLPESELLELEAKIGNFCSRQMAPMHSMWGSFRTAYEPIARIHMLCCRMKLRAPGLSTQASWLPSLCICTHAAQNVLATYLQLYQPVLIGLAEQCNARDVQTENSSTAILCSLAVTWRQVKRIMASAFVIIFAYWHGEILHSEASRYMAMARLLLEYPRWRWGEKLDKAVQTLVDISGLADFSIYQHMNTVLPGLNEQFLRHICSPLPSPVENDYATDHTDMPDHALSATASWPTMHDSIVSGGLAGFNFSTIEEQTLFGLWESIEFPWDGGALTGNTP